MGICQGEPIEYQDVMPEELQALRKSIATWLEPMVGQRATALPEGMPVAAGTSPLTYQAQDVMSGMMGYGATPWGSTQPVYPGNYGIGTDPTFNLDNTWGGFEPVIPPNGEDQKKNNGKKDDEDKKGRIAWNDPYAPWYTRQ